MGEEVNYRQTLEQAELIHVGKGLLAVRGPFLSKNLLSS